MLLIPSSRYSRDGGINSSELKGDMILTVNAESAAFVRVNLAPIRDKSLQLKNHPNINKQVRRAFCPRMLVCDVNVFCVMSAGLM